MAKDKMFGQRGAVSTVIGVLVFLSVLSLPGVSAAGDPLSIPEEAVVTPVRRIVGDSGNYRHGMALVYENPDGTAGVLFVGLDGDDMGKIRFVDGGGDRIVWKKSVWGRLFENEAVEPVRILLMRRP